MNDTLVVGIGSPYGADRLGWQVIDALRVIYPPVDAQLVQCRQPAELPALLSGWRRVILIDALLGGRISGTLLRLSREDLSNAGLGVSSHGFDVSAALKLAEMLGNSPDQLLVLGLEVGEKNQPVRPEWIERLVLTVLAEISSAV